jgi:hypothetical protein
MSAEEFLAHITSHVERLGCRPEESQTAPVGQLLLFRFNEGLHVVCFLPNPPLLGKLWDVTSVKVAGCGSVAKFERLRVVM